MSEKTGLVLEGGAMRGMYTAAVLDVFLENGIKFDAAVGVSAGALCGMNYLSKQPGRVIRYTRRFNKDRSYMGLKPLIREGNVFNTEYAYHRVPNELDLFDYETYLNSDMPFYAVVTNVETGKPEYIRIKDVEEQMDTLRASASMPMISKAVEIDGQKYLDGGISDSIPFEWLYRQGYRKQVVVLTRDIDYVKKPFSKSAAKVLLRKMPRVKKQMLRRHEVYNKKIAVLKQLEEKGRIFIIRPSKPITIGKLERDEDKLQMVYDLGRSDCEKLLPELLKFLDHDN